MTDPSGRNALQIAYGECERIVRERDSDRAVAIGFADARARMGLYALYAFDIEIAGIRDHVSQPLPGEIRIQWWRDCLSASAAVDTPGQGSPVAFALIDTIRSAALPLDAFDRYLEARIFDLYDDPMGSRQDFETYAGETTAAVIMLACMILDRARAPAAADAAGHAGVAQAAIEALRFSRRYRARNQVLVPSDILAATGVDAVAWLRGGEATMATEQAMAAFASDHLEKAERQIASLSPSIRPAFLPALIGRRRLRQPGLTAEPIGPLSRLWAYWSIMRR